ncbi:MAG: hypothetical protein GY810_06595 [Aureispira sp.]|nr:hypothetical protein [Aureispira sp.]
MKHLFFILVALSLLSSGCDKNKESNLELVFKATHEGQALVMYDQYNASNNRAIIYKALEFFISDINITNTDGSVVNITDVDYVKLSSLTTQNKAEEGIKLLFTDVEAVGSFQSINFGVGVSASLNAKEPGDYSTTSPLGDEGNYWTAWNSYIFSRLEGSYFDASNNKTPFLYHSGVDGSYQQLSFNKDFSLKKGETTTIEFELTAEDIIFKDGSEIDVPNNPISHSGAEGTDAYNLALSTVRNIAQAIHIK